MEWAASGEVIEAEEGPVDEDEFIAEAWDARSSDSTSLTSSVYAHTYAHGRRYHKFRAGRYPIPNDDIEQNRQDMMHALMLELTVRAPAHPPECILSLKSALDDNPKLTIERQDGRLFYAPISDHPHKIIDLGTGTGIWALEMGDQYPSAEVLGLDLSPIQTPWVPPNVRFLVDDIEDDWLNGSDWDFAHFRTMANTIRNLEEDDRSSFQVFRTRQNNQER